MKLVTFAADQGSRVGCVTERGVVPLDAITRSMLDLIEHWVELAGPARSAAEIGVDALPLESVRLLAPVPRPGKIMAIGLNYKDHILESGAATPTHQLWFSMASTAVNGPYAPIEIPKAAPATVDYEGELVAIVGRRGRHIPREDAAAHVFGYCCGNDISVREWQRHTPQWTLGKSFDTHAPFGPWIVTADEIGDPHRLDISCLVNGEMRQRSNTRHLLFDVWDQVAHLSEAMTLEPGDVLFTGTPGGIGARMAPPTFLKPGDRVAVEIEAIGRIEAQMSSEH